MNSYTIEGVMRLYESRTGLLFPSVTTALGEMKKDSLEEWRRRIGREEADKIGRRAAALGTRLHSICEKYLNNDPAYRANSFPGEIELFSHLRPFLDEKIEVVYGQEFPLWSKDLGVAGRCDAFCMMEGRPTIVDFKSSSKPKKEEWIENYFFQATAYAMMVMERKKVPVTRFAILVSSPEGLQVFHKPVKDYIEKTREYFHSYRTSKGHTQEYFRGLIGAQLPDKREE